MPVIATASIQSNPALPSSSGRSDEIAVDANTATTTRHTLYDTASRITGR